MEKIMMVSEEGEEISLYVLDQASLGGKNYLLVTDVEEGDGCAMVLRDEAAAQDAESVYEFVEDDDELYGVLTLFRDTLEELGIDLEDTDE